LAASDLLARKGVNDYHSCKSPIGDHILVFLQNWDAPLSVGLEQKSKQINQPVAILFEFPT
jgi:hypothetical protein